jgi:hypothetical protein
MANDPRKKYRGESKDPEHLGFCWVKSFKMERVYRTSRGSHFVVRGKSRQPVKKVRNAPKQVFETYYPKKK